ncbi:hypothetical protein ACFX2I_011175 [Malus domestica]
MTDSLCINGGEVHNLCQVTYLLADKADQTPDGQTVLFSAMFPPGFEALGRKILLLNNNNNNNNKPVGIQVVRRSLVNKNITQLVEARRLES